MLAILYRGLQSSSTALPIKDFNLQSDDADLSQQQHSYLPPDFSFNWYKM